MDKLRSGKGLSKKRKNLIGGNFNVVENDRLANQNDNLERNRLENQEMVAAKRLPQGLYHQGNAQTTGSILGAVARPWLISNLPLPPYHLILQ